MTVSIFKISPTFNIITYYHCYATTTDVGALSVTNCRYDTRHSNVNEISQYLLYPDKCQRQLIGFVVISLTLYNSDSRETLFYVTYLSNTNTLMGHVVMVMCIVYSIIYGSRAPVY